MKIKRTGRAYPNSRDKNKKSIPKQQGEEHVDKSIPKQQGKEQKSKPNCGNKHVRKEQSLTVGRR